LPVSVPGCVDGWFALHDKFGKLPMKDVLAPAIKYAREGFPLTELIAFYWNLSVPRLSKFPGFTEQMTLDGKAPAKGQIWKNANLANTLQTIADGGRDAFYKGKIAHTIADYMKALQKNKAKYALVTAATKTKAENVALPALIFEATSDNVLREQITEAQKPAAAFDYRINEMLGILTQGEKERDKIAEPRWRAVTIWRWAAPWRCTSAFTATTS